MIQTVLHILAHQLGVLGKNVELRGAAGTIPVGKPTDNSQTVAVTEFIVDTERLPLLVLIKTPYLLWDKDKLAEGRTQGLLKLEVHKPVALRLENNMIQPILHNRATLLPLSNTTPIMVALLQLLHLGRRTLRLIFNILEQLLVTAQHAHPVNRPYPMQHPELAQKDSLSSQGNLKAITDMWNNMNVASRLDACEEGIGVHQTLEWRKYNKSKANQINLTAHLRFQEGNLPKQDSQLKELNHLKEPNQRKVDNQIKADNQLKAGRRLTSLAIPFLHLA
ncbi:unnamed protein product [Spodoptera exigua]|nr:unnamed protein product [Spodoptera exigua]